MIFEETPLSGVFLIELEPAEDERGSFARTFSTEEFSEHGLSPKISHCSVSFNRRPGTLRGMHYQVDPGAECKLVRCTRGAIHDVALDLRQSSGTFGRWYAVELSPDNGRMLYIPEGVAHGFQTIQPESEVHYQISEPYQPELARGVRWDDPAFGIVWPEADERTISERDRQFPDFRR